VDQETHSVTSLGDTSGSIPAGQKRFQPSHNPSSSKFLWDSGYKNIQSGAHFFWVFFSANRMQKRMQ
jgi:hypothetical protein